MTTPEALSAAALERILGGASNGFPASLDETYALVHELKRVRLAMSVERARATRRRDEAAGFASQDGWALVLITLDRLEAAQ